jgi:CheY-like chemotaxis protein
MNDNAIQILLVEDDSVDVMNVQRAFKKLNITNILHVANNGLEGLAMLRGDGVPQLDPQPKIILLDLNMPKMNGIEFLGELRKDPNLRRISVFVLTTSDDDRDKVAAYDYNVAGYILKPVESPAFIEAVSTLGMYWSLIEMP